MGERQKELLGNPAMDSVKLSASICNVTPFIEVFRYILRLTFQLSYCYYIHRNPLS
jgi:hypothetical protein